MSTKPFLLCMETLYDKLPDVTTRKKKKMKITFNSQGKSTIKFYLIVSPSLLQES